MNIAPLIAGEITERLSIVTPTLAFLTSYYVFIFFSFLLYCQAGLGFEFVTNFSTEFTYFHLHMDVWTFSFTGHAPSITLSLKSEH